MFIREKEINQPIKGTQVISHRTFDKHARNAYVQCSLNPFASEAV